MKKILSLSGGGIRGLCICRILIALEDELQKRRPGVRIFDVFDEVAGVSTGGIITLLGLMRQYSASEILGLYKAECKSIFTREWSFWGFDGPKYSDRGMIQMGEKYASNLTLSSLPREVCILAYDLDACRGFTFTRESKFYLADVLRATCAAPTYFPPACVTSCTGHVHHFIDGGMVANDPSMTVAVRNWTKHREKMFIVNISCGRKPVNYSYDKMKGAGKVAWIDPIIDILIDGGVKHDDHELHQLLGESFIRFNPILNDASNALDDCSDKNVAALIADTEAYIATEHAQMMIRRVIDQIC